MVEDFLTTNASEPTLRLLPDAADRHALVCRYIARHARPEAPLEVLEAGCGRQWPLMLGDLRFRLTGIDLDADALEHRRTVKRDLDVAVVGDLRTIELPASRFDVIYCAFVLEHVASAAQVLENFARWLRPGGLLVMQFPDRDSAFGFVARHTPFWMHIAYHRYVLGRREAGRPGHAPYPTVYDPALSRAAIHEYCRRRSLRVCEELAFGFGAPRPVSLAGSAAVSALSLGRLAWRHNNLLFIIEKPAATAP
jgi:SAM-dependent methyltransferase